MKINGVSYNTKYWNGKTEAQFVAQEKHHFDGDVTEAKAAFGLLKTGMEKQKKDAADAKAQAEKEAKEQKNAQDALNVGAKGEAEAEPPAPAAGK